MRKKKILLTSPSERIRKKKKAVQRNTNTTIFELINIHAIFTGDNIHAEITLVQIRELDLILVHKVDKHSHIFMTNTHKTMKILELTRKENTVPNLQINTQNIKNIRNVVMIFLNLYLLISKHHI